MQLLPSSASDSPTPPPRPTAFGSNERLLNKADVIKELGVCRNTLLRWIRNAEQRGIPSPFVEMTPGGRQVATLATLREWSARVRAANAAKQAA